MAVSALEIVNFRNLRQVGLACSPGLNLIVGDNATGKTSLLEALYFLGRARSFRTRRINDLIRDGETAFRVFAKMQGEVQTRLVPVGIERSLRDITVRIDGAPVHSLAELARQVPVLLLNPGSHRLLEDGPQQRRRFMDWGLFHRDGRFLGTWKRFVTALRHRNAALRTGADNRSIDAWDEELSQAAMALGQLRNDFCDVLQEALTPLVRATLGEVRVTVDYRRGWAHEQDLAAVLHSAREQDRKHGYTRTGPQRADFVIKLDGRVGSGHLSRGQQKLLVIALVLAQARLYQAARGDSSILLIDDLPAELDRSHRDKAMACLAGAGSQLFITAIEAQALTSATWSDVRMFNIHQGNIKEVV